MGLASALSTALTGLTASETTIDVVGNNVANANTVGFKSSKALFATQFLQTLSLGSAPTDSRGGTNPRQVGLGVKVSQITTDFTQGTIEVSSSASDLAIQDDGFFIVQGAQGESLYTRNGVFKTNSSNELVNSTGQRLLGFGIDENFVVQQTELVPLTIPLGAAQVAQATQNVVFAGTLTPTGDIATEPGVISSSPLGDASKPIPADLDAADIFSLLPPTFTTTPTDSGVAGVVPAGTYTYRVTLVTADGAEGPASIASDPVTTTGNQITLNPMPAVPSGFASYNVYRAGASGVYSQVASGVAGGGTFTDNVAAGSGALPETLEQGNYSYYITFYDSTDGSESRPTSLIGPQSITVDGRRIELRNLPVPSEPYDSIRIYRNSPTASDSFRLVTTPALTGTSSGYISGTSTTFIDGLSQDDWESQEQIDFDNPPINPATLLTDVVRRDGANYVSLFQEGTLEFTGTKGGRDLATKSFQITSTTTVQDYVEFVQDAFGIRTDIPTPSTLDDPSTVLTAGGNVDASSGRISFTGNYGTGNQPEISLSSFRLTPTGGTAQTVDMGFTTTQNAVGNSVTSEFVVYDSLGIPIRVAVTAVLESRDTDTVAYRWFADSAGNQAVSNGESTPEISVGTGLIYFDGEGNVTSVSNDTISIAREDVSSGTLEFDLDFTGVSGLASANSTLSATLQDGSAPGVLTSFIVGEDGLIRGVFSNGITRDLGQIQLARFANNSGLQQKGENLFATGVNSGLPIVGSPGAQGIGTIIAGAQELSNSDIGQNLIDLITASTAYRGGARVITTVQQLFDELLNLRR
jgi:flagellar hook protein FlgE